MDRTFKLTVDCMNSSKFFKSHERRWKSLRPGGLQSGKQISISHFTRLTDMSATNYKNSSAILMQLPEGRIAGATREVGSITPSLALQCDDYTKVGTIEH